MDAVQLGPLLISMQVALLAAAIFLANGAAAWWHKARGLDPGPILWKMIGVGLVSARLVFVLRHADLYTSNPLALLDFRDGGFDGVAGLIAACVVGAELTRRQIALRWPLAMVTLLGCTVWFGGTLLNQVFSPPDMALPALDLRRLDGSTVALGQFAGRPLVVNLWASWCGPCRREMPALKAAQQAHPDVTFVFVNQGESAQTVAQYLATHKLVMENVLVDPAKQLGTRTGALGFPTTLFFDAAGRLQLRHLGELSQATVQDKIELVRAAR